MASISFLAIPTVIDASMQEEVRAEKLADATVTMRPLSLTDEQVAALEALPNVAAIEPGIRVNARVLVGERRAPALVIGVRNFARQGVDVVRVASGRLPARARCSPRCRTQTSTSTTAAPVTSHASSARGGLRIRSAAGRNIPGGEEVQDEDVIVLYATSGTIAALGGERG